MARELRDVLHHLLPETRGSARRPEAAPVAGVAVGLHDMVGAALCSSLAAELARQGARVTLLASTARGAAALWPEPGRGESGLQFVPSDAGDAELLLRDAGALARRPVRAPGPRLVLVALPPDWLRRVREAAAALPFLLLPLPDLPRALEAGGTLLAEMATARGTRRAGVVVHGAQSSATARRAGEDFAVAAARRMGAPVRCLGGLPDDLEIYRAIAGRRPGDLCRAPGPASRGLAHAARAFLAELEGPTAPADPSGGSVRQLAPLGA